MPDEQSDSKSDKDPDIDQAEEVHVGTREPEDYDINPASGVRGGIQARGDFLIEFYIERYPEGEFDVYEYEDGIGKPVRREGVKNDIIRDKQTGVMMSQRNAYRTALWVISNILGEGVTEEEVGNLISNEYEDRFN